jgi:hypothetical protein
VKHLHPDGGVDRSIPRRTAEIRRENYQRRPESFPPPIGQMFDGSSDGRVLFRRSLPQKRLHLL